MKVAIASSITTLDDYLKTDVCEGRIIHCQFPYAEILGKYWEYMIRRSILEKNIHEVVFSDGVVIKGT